MERVCFFKRLEFGNHQFDSFKIYVKLSKWPRSNVVKSGDEEHPQNISNFARYPK